MIASPPSASSPGSWLSAPGSWLARHRHRLRLASQPLSCIACHCIVRCPRSPIPSLAGLRLALPTLGSTAAFARLSASWLAAACTPSGCNACRVLSSLGCRSQVRCRSPSVPSVPVSRCRAPTKVTRLAARYAFCGRASLAAACHRRVLSSHRSVSIVHMNCQAQAPVLWSSGRCPIRHPFQFLCLAPALALTKESHRLAALVQARLPIGRHA